ncbi:MAG TPA: selenocysteine-specific translation elongation factor [Candidatus Limnocylindrales bacterium]|nr:selenocysteine-specific translation elongation factor [Candidatus Limnocylindrales bacterium]
MTVVVGTAGHIDHGKTTLLRALTGIDADRLPEERARGMTIDVGYAHLALPDGTELDFVDVPGHDKLVGNMLVGAGEIDAALLVVAADDGPRAQTREHLELLDALGLATGLAVVTKTDAVEPERVAEVMAAVGRLLAATTLAGAPVLAASSTTGAGLDEVRRALIDVRERVVRAGPDERFPPTLAIDRVFAVRGRGTVVTGTLRGGRLDRGALLRIVPGADGATARVREIQVHNRTVESAGSGRTALNVALAGGAAGLERGTVLSADPAVVATDRLLISTRPRLADRTVVSLHLGTARVTGVIAATGRDGFDLGDGSGSAILRLDRPVAAAPGGRFVLRRPSPAGTLAGGLVLDPLPPRGAARRRATAARVGALAAADPGSDGWLAARRELHGMVPGDGSTSADLAADLVADLDRLLLETVVARGTIASAELVRLGEAALRRRVGSVAGLDRAIGARLEAAVDDGRLTRRGASIGSPGADADRRSPDLDGAMERLVALLSVASPPPLADAAATAGCPPEGIGRLEREGRIVRLDASLAWSADAYAALATRALELAGQAPLTPAAFRDATGTSRKYVMAILEDLDRRAVLRRTAAGHVPGPRAATFATGVRG